MKFPKSSIRLVRLPILFSGAALVAGALLLAGCIADIGSSSKSEAKAEVNTEENTLAVAAYEVRACPTWIVNEFENKIGHHDRYWHEQRNVAAIRMKLVPAGSPQYRYWQGQWTNAAYSIGYWHNQAFTWSKMNWSTLKTCHLPFDFPISGV
jgi:hypothetical protein